MIAKLRVQTYKDTRELETLVQDFLPSLQCLSVANKATEGSDKSSIKKIIFSRISPYIRRSIFLNCLLLTFCQ